MTLDQPSPRVARAYVTNRARCTSKIRCDRRARSGVGANGANLGFGQDSLMVALAAWCALAVSLVLPIVSVGPISQMGRLPASPGIPA